MSNFAKYENLQALFTAIGKKKLSVSDTMPTAGATYEDVCILYIGPTDANYTKGYVYECEEVTPATDPKTYSWNAKINVDVDLSKYKTIFPGTKEEWEALTEAQQDQYDYCFFDGDESDYYAVSDEVTKGDMHPVTSNAVAENIQDMNNVYGSKNLCPTFMSGTIAGVTYTVNLDGSITAVGTSNASTAFMNTTEAHLPNGDYIMSAGADASTDLRFVVKIKKDGTPKYYEVDSANKEVSFTVDDPDSLDIYVRTNGGDVSINGTLYPMIRCASISDNTYRPYVPTNSELLSADTNAVLGAHNLVDVSIAYASRYGVDFTNEGDNKIKLNGTSSTANANVVYKMHLKPGTYIASIQVLSGTHNTAKTLWIEKEVGTTAIDPDITITTETYKEKQFTVSTEGDYKIQIGIAKDDVFSNLVLGYMIRFASDPSTTYAPYAKTNRELTEELTVSKGVPTANTDYIASSDLHYEKYGKVVHVFGNFETNTAILSTDSLILLFSDLPLSNGGMNGTSSQYTLCLLHDNTNDGLSYRCFVSNEGKLVSRYKAIPIGTYFADFTYICQ